MAKETKIYTNVELPFFAGFYDSALLNDDMIYYELNDEEALNAHRETLGDDSLTSDDLEINIAQYKEDCARTFCYCLEGYLPSFVKSVIFDKVKSPKEYNFETDSVYATIIFDDGWRDEIVKFLEEYKFPMGEIIKEDWSDRDGFISFLPNDIEDWIREFKEEKKPNELMVSEMLGYMTIDENPRIEDELVEDVLTDIDLCDYVERKSPEEDLEN